jgi:periplasmic copper chaperone A
MKEHTSMRRTTLALTAAALLAVPAAAQAHVTIQPQEVPAGSYARLDVRVPNERDDAGTTKVEVQMPDGIASASYEAVPGWTVEVVREDAPEPIELHGEQVTEQIDTVTFTGDEKRGIVEPGQFRDFGLSVRTPDGEPGETITFKAIQTYESGEVVRWIGPEDSDEPAATITLAEAPGEHGASADDAGDEDVSAAPASAPVAGDDDGGSGNGLSIAALIVGALGLTAGIAGLMAGRRARTEARSGGRVATQP